MPTTGVIMKHYYCSQRVTTKLAPINKSFGRLALSLSFCVVLFGCDSQSTSTAAAEDKIAAKANQEITAEITTQAPISTSQNDDHEGTSLLDAASNDRKPVKRSAPMISEKRADSALQAVLIGDYMGMLSCRNCEGISLTLNLRADGTMQKTSFYRSPQQIRPPVIESGIYRQDDNMITVVYDEENVENYVIQDNHLVLLDADKQPDPDYTLSRK